MCASESGGCPSTRRWSFASCASCVMRQLKVPLLKKATDENITCSSISHITTSPESFDPASRNLLGWHELAQTTSHSRTWVADQSLSAISSVSPVFSRASDASTEVSVLPRIANQLTAYPIPMSLLWHEEAHTSF